MYVFTYILDGRVNQCPYFHTSQWSKLGNVLISLFISLKVWSDLYVELDKW
jgi:hypothetical protein